MAVYQCQLTAFDELRRAYEHDVHSIIIEGNSGCGKTYLAVQFAKFLDDAEFVQIKANVADIRSMIATTSLTSVPTVICIENIDAGAASAAHALLKILEEPQPNLYIIVTCRNIKHVPATIISRSIVVSVSTPTSSDIQSYIQKFPAESRKTITQSKLWKIVRSFHDADILFSTSADKLNYLSEFTINFKRDNISTIIWNIGHYPDNSETDIIFMLKYLMFQYSSLDARSVFIDAINDIESKRVADHAVIAKLLLTLKYAI